MKFQRNFFSIFIPALKMTSTRLDTLLKKKITWFVNLLEFQSPLLSIAH